MNLLIILYNQVMSIVPFLWSPFKGAALVFMIVYVWSRENPNARVSIHGLVEIKVHSFILYIYIWNFSLPYSLTVGWYWSFLYICIYIFPQGFYLPWVLLGIDTIIGNPWKPGLEGIAAGHIYYFLTVLHPLAGGKNYCKTPLLVYPKYIFNWNSCFLFLYICH